MFIITRNTNRGTLEFATDFGSGWTCEIISAVSFRTKKEAAAFQATLTGATQVESLKAF